MMVGKEEKGAGGEEASEEAADGPRKAAIQAAFKGYVLAIMLFFSVFALGLALSFIFHGYGLTDALYWTISCMTTAGGDLNADDDPLLETLYILYMPLAVVGALTAANTFLSTSKLRNVRLDNYEIKFPKMLTEEARREKNPFIEMRESDFVIAVLKSHSLVDNETIGAIREQFGKLVAIDLDQKQDQKCINAKVLFKHLVRQQRVVSKGLQGAAKIGKAVERRASTVFVDTHGDDKGYQEWWDGHWNPEVSIADGVGSPAGAPSAGSYKRLVEEEKAGYNA